MYYQYRRPLASGKAKDKTRPLGCIPVRVNLLPDEFTVPAMFRALNGDRLLDKDHALLCIEEWLVILYGQAAALGIGFTQQVAEVRARHVRCHVGAFGQSYHISLVDPMRIVLDGLE